MVVFNARGAVGLNVLERRKRLEILLNKQVNLMKGTLSHDQFIELCLMIGNKI